MKLFYGQIFPEIKLNDEEQIHISKVLRIKEGSTIFISDGKGNLAEGKIQYQGKKTILIEPKISEKIPNFASQLHIAIAPTKNIDRLEFFIEKATEMGISKISFLHTENSERKIINLEKIQKQVIAASKQSLRVHFPILNPLMKLPDFIQKNGTKNTFVAHCDSSFERKSLEQIKSLNDFTILVGPEGDFSPKEIEFLEKNHISAITLGSQRLRTETAGIFLSAWNYNKMLELK